MALIKISDLPKKESLDESDKIVGYSDTGGTTLLLGAAFSAIQKSAAASATAAASSATAASASSNAAGGSASSAQASASTAETARAAAEAAKGAAEKAQASAEAARTTAQEASATAQGAKAVVQELKPQVDSAAASASASAGAAKKAEQSALNAESRVDDKSVSLIQGLENKGAEQAQRVTDEGDKQAKILHGIVSTNLSLERYVLESSGSPTYPMGDAVNVLVFINSVLAIEGDAYGIASKNIVFNQPLSAGTEICLVKFVSVGSITPSISLTLDSALSESSTNAVQNKAIAQKFAEIQASIDALYAKYAAELGA